MSLLLLVLALSQPSTGKLALTYGGFALADLASTELALSRGATEGNPLVRDRGARFAVNAAVVGLSVIADRKLQRTGHRRAARVVRFSFVAMRVLVVASNLRTANRGRR